MVSRKRQLTTSARIVVSMFGKIKLFAEWVFDWFILPVIESFRASKDDANGGDSDAATGDKPGA